MGYGLIGEENDEWAFLEDDLKSADPPVTPVSACLNSLIGLNNLKTMKLLGKILGEEVVVMKNPGATHTFLSLAVIHKTHIPIHPTADFGVTLGTVCSVTGSGECQEVLLGLGTLEIMENFFSVGVRHFGFHFGYIVT